MKKHQRKSQTQKQVLRYATRIGLPLVLIAIGISLFFTPNFWTGVIVFCIGIWLAARDIARQPFVRRLNRRSKIVLRTACIATVLIFAWWLFRPVQVELEASSSVPTYGEGTIISGMPWNKNLSELRLSVRNNSDIDYDDLDIAITTDETFWGLRQTGGLASCAIAPQGQQLFVTSQRMVGVIPVAPNKSVGGAPVGPADTSQQHEIVIGVDSAGRMVAFSGGINPSYRIRCEKFPAHNINTFVGALVVLSPMINGTLPRGILFADPKPANEFSVKVDFSTAGRPRTTEISNCQMGQTCKG